MRVGLIVMALLFLISSDSYAQQWQTVFSVDSRVGYSSNTYLNPYTSEWNRNLDSGYGVLSGMGQTAWFDSVNTAELTAGAFFEPYLPNGQTTGGGYAMASYSRKFTPKLRGGLETGTSYFSSTYTRTLFWIQPTLSWMPSPFTRVNAKVGSNFRSYDNYYLNGISADSNERTDLYSLEFETWPSFRWQFTAAVYGNLDVLPAVGEAFSSRVGGSYTFDDGSRLRVTAGLQQYKNNQTSVSSGGGGMPGGGITPTTGTIEQTSRIYSLSVEGSKPLNERFSVFANIEGMRFNSTTTAQPYNDVHLSAGIRMMFAPKLKKNSGQISPDWMEKNNKQQVRITYRNKGQLYLVGDFNNWDRPGIPLVNTNKNNYVAELDLQPGSYEYKILYVVNEEEKWLPFSKDTYTVGDGFGGENALLLVE